MGQSSTGISNIKSSLIFEKQPKGKIRVLESFLAFQSYKTSKLNRADMQFVIFEYEKNCKLVENCSFSSFLVKNLCSDERGDIAKEELWKFFLQGLQPVQKVKGLFENCPQKNEIVFEMYLRAFTYFLRLKNIEMADLYLKKLSSTQTPNRNTFLITSKWTTDKLLKIKPFYLNRTRQYLKIILKHYAFSNYKFKKKINTYQQAWIDSYIEASIATDSHHLTMGMVSIFESDPGKKIANLMGGNLKVFSSVCEYYMYKNQLKKCEKLAVLINNSEQSLNSRFIFSKIRISRNKGLVKEGLNLVESAKKTSSFQKGQMIKALLTLQEAALLSDAGKFMKSQSLTQSLLRINQKSNYIDTKMWAMVQMMSNQVSQNNFIEALKISSNLEILFKNEYNGSNLIIFWNNLYKAYAFARLGKTVNYSMSLDRIGSNVQELPFLKPFLKIAKIFMIKDPKKKISTFQSVESEIGGQFPEVKQLKSFLIN